MLRRRVASRLVHIANKTKPSQIAAAVRQGIPVINLLENKRRPMHRQTISVNSKNLREVLFSSLQDAFEWYKRMLHPQV